MPQSACLPPGNWRCISAAIPRPSRSKRLFQEKRRKRGRQAFAHGKAGDLFAHGRDEFEAVSAKAAQNEDARVFGVQADNEVFRRGAVVAAHFAVTQRARLREVLLQEAVCVAPVVIVAVRIALGCCPHDFATVVAPHFEAITAIREAVVDAIGRFRGKAGEAVAFLIGRGHVVPGEGFAYRGKRQLESESGDVIRPGACTQGDAVRMVVLRATFDTQYFCFACDTGNRLVKGGIGAVALCAGWWRACRRRCWRWACSSRSATAFSLCR